MRRNALPSVIASAKEDVDKIRDFLTKSYDNKQILAIKISVISQKMFISNHDRKSVETMNVTMNVVCM